MCSTPCRAAISLQQALAFLTVVLQRISAVEEKAVVDMRARRMQVIKPVPGRSRFNTAMEANPLAAVNLRCCAGSPSVKSVGHTRSLLFSAGTVQCACALQDMAVETPSQLGIQQDIACALYA